MKYNRHIQLKHAWQIGRIYNGGVVGGVLAVVGVLYRRVIH